MSKNAKRISNSQSVNNLQNAKRDEVLKRMLKMPPQPQKRSTAKDSDEPNLAKQRRFP
jgi:hypothetical protein